MSARTFEVSNFFVGVGGGAAVALLYLWPLPFTLRGALGVLLAGAVTGFALATGAYVFRRFSGILLYAAVGLAGACGGAAWWLVVRPPSTIFLAGAIGAVIVAIVVAVEGSVEPGVR
jgi:hypothetical protein